MYGVSAGRRGRLPGRGGALSLVARDELVDLAGRAELGHPAVDDGETYEAMQERVLAAVRRIAADHPDGLALAVSHGGSIRAIHAAALGLDVHAYRRLRPVEPNARLSAVCVVDGRLTELCAAPEIEDLVARDQRERLEAAQQPPTPAG